MKGYLAPGTKETIQDSQLLYTSLEHMYYRTTEAWISKFASPPQNNRIEQLVFFQSKVEGRLMKIKGDYATRLPKGTGVQVLQRKQMDSNNRT